MIVELYIDGKAADVDGAPSFALTKTFEPILDPATIRTASSKTISLPATPANNRIFNHIGRLDARTFSFDPRSKSPFVLAINGMDMMLGYVKLNSVAWHLDEPRYYNITLFEATGDILNYMRDLDCTDIAMPHNNLSHVIDRNAISAPPQDCLYFPSYQGLYSAFESNKYQAISGEVIDFDRDYDENELQEYRSYYQRFAVKFSTVFTAMMAAMPWFTNCSEGVLDSPYYRDTVICLPPPFKDNESNNLEGTQQRTPISTNHPNYTKWVEMRNDHLTNPIQFGGEIGWDELNSSPIYTGTAIDVSGQKSTDLFAIRMKARLFGRVDYNEAPIGGEFQFMGVNGVNNPHELEIVAQVLNENNEVVQSQDIYYRIGADDIYLNKEEAGQHWAACYFHRSSGERIDDVEVNMNVPVGTNQQFRIRLIIKYTNQPIEDISWQWRYNPGTGYTVLYNGDLSVAISEDSKFMIVQQESTRSGSTISWSSLMPRGKTQLDLFTSFVKSFGLMTRYDPIHKRLDVMTRNEFFEGYQILDWTDKVDYFKSAEVKPLTFDYRFAELGHTPSKSYRNGTYRESTEAINGEPHDYGEQVVDTGWQFDKSMKQLLENSMFTTMILSSEYGRMFNGRSSEVGRDDKILPLIAERDGSAWKSVDDKFQLAFDNGWVTCQPYRITDDTPQMIGENSYMWYSTGDNPGSNSVIKTEYRQLARVQNSFSLDFGKPSEAYYPLNDTEYPESATIYARMWQEYIRERLSIDTRIMTCYVHITPSEFFGWNFNRFVRIHDTIWHVNKIENFDPLITASTKVELVRVRNIEAYTHGQNLT